jgi:hypothetical protein
MHAQELAMGAPDAAVALKKLAQVIDDPNARARTRLAAVQLLKMRLRWLQHLVEAPQTTLDLRKEIIETLRSYRRS